VTCVIRNHELAQSVPSTLNPVVNKLLLTCSDLTTQTSVCHERPAEHILCATQNTFSHRIQTDVGGITPPENRLGLTAWYTGRLNITG
jgi:hypothetical protein